MKIKQTVKVLFLSLGLALASLAVITPTATVSAECDPATQSCCGGVQTSLITCTQEGGDGAPIEETGIWGILLIVINILTAGVAIVAVGGIVFASIQYSSAGGNPEQVKKAMTTITNIVIGILAYALMFAVLNFVVPGGLFN